MINPIIFVFNLFVLYVIVRSLASEHIEYEHSKTHHFIFGLQIAEILGLVFVNSCLTPAQLSVASFGHVWLAGSGAGEVDPCSRSAGIKLSHA
jgi:hypothetical protein